MYIGRAAVEARLGGGEQPLLPLVRHDGEAGDAEAGARGAVDELARREDVDERRRLPERRREARALGAAHGDVERHKYRCKAYV